MSENASDQKSTIASKLADQLQAKLDQRVANARSDLGKYHELVLVSVREHVDHCHPFVVAVVEINRVTHDDEWLVEALLEMLRLDGFLKLDADVDEDEYDVDGENVRHWNIELVIPVAEEVKKILSQLVVDRLEDKSTPRGVPEVPR